MKRDKILSIMLTQQCIMCNVTYIFISYYIYNSFMSNDIYIQGGQQNFLFFKRNEPHGM